MENVFTQHPVPDAPVQKNKVIMPRQPKAKTHPRRMHQIKKALAQLAVTILILTSLLIYGTYKINQWFDGHEIIIQLPVRIVPRGHQDDKPQAALVSEVHAASPNEGQNIALHSTVVQAAGKPSVESIVAAIYQLESSSTNSEGCAAKGLYNGYGYDPGSCYKSHAYVRSLVTSWVKARIDKMPLAKLLCGYNLGFSSKHLTECIKQSPNYPYYRDYLNLQ